VRKPWAVSLARWVARRMVARGLDGVWVQGLAAARELAARKPVLFCATHVAWWDALVLLPVDGALRTESHVLMDATQLARLPYFGPIGAIGVDRANPMRLLRSFRAAEHAVDGPGRALWVFPQGRQRPSHLRPLGLQRGYDALARRTGATVIPVALTYAFREAPQPAALLSFGAPVSPDGLESALEAGLARIDRFLSGDVGEAFEPLITGRGGRTDDTLASRGLATITRWLTGGARA
jgi:1-acyl-sn-glycerol-3-phosphate acyltransferase